MLFLLCNKKQLAKHIPNFLTLLNLFCGCIAAVFAINGSMKLTAIFVFLGVFFDFFDGLLARKLNVQSELGLQLDSLADMITSGLVPGLVMFHLLKLAIADFGFIPQYDSIERGMSLLPFLGFIITLASAYRLANFNIDVNQKEGFIGLPTPANALLILSLPLILEYQNGNVIESIITNKWILIAITLLSSYLLNAKINLIALKFKTWSFKDNVLRYTLIILSVILLILLKFIAIPIIVLVYLILSLIKI